VGHHLQLNPARQNSNDEWHPDQVLAEALAEREQFLETYPEYRSYQDEIDNMLDKAGSSEKRMAVLALLMEAKLIELQDELKHLNRLLLNTASLS
jgi:hypothetical protein